MIPDTSHPAHVMAEVLFPGEYTSVRITPAGAGRPWWSLSRNGGLAWMREWLGCLA